MGAYIGTLHATISTILQYCVRFVRHHYNIVKWELSDKTNLANDETHDIDKIDEEKKDNFILWLATQSWLLEYKLCFNGCFLYVDNSIDKIKIMNKIYDKGFWDFDNFRIVIVGQRNIPSASTAEASIAEASHTDDASIAEASIAEASIAEASIAEASIAEASHTDDASIAEASIAEARVAKASIAEIRRDEARVAKAIIAANDAEAMYIVSNNILRFRNIK